MKSKNPAGLKSALDPLSGSDDLVWVCSARQRNCFYSPLTGRLIITDGVRLPGVCLISDLGQSERKKGLRLPGKGNNSSGRARFSQRVPVQGGSRVFSFIPLMHGSEGSTAERKTEFQPYPPLPNIIILVFFCVVVQIIWPSCSARLCPLWRHLLILLPMSCSRL